MWGEEWRRVWGQFQPIFHISLIQINFSIKLILFQFADFFYEWIKEIIVYFCLFITADAFNSIIILTFRLFLPLSFSIEGNLNIYFWLVSIDCSLTWTAFSWISPLLKHGGEKNKNAAEKSYKTPVNLQNKNFNYRVLVYDYNSSIQCAILYNLNFILIGLSLLEYLQEK